VGKVGQFNVSSFSIEFPSKGRLPKFNLTAYYVHVLGWKQQEWPNNPSGNVHENTPDIIYIASKSGRLAKPTVDQVSAFDCPKCSLHRPWCVFVAELC